MISLKYFTAKLRDVKPADLLSAFPMAAALVLRPFYRKRYENAWLVCEEPAEARDNGYHFFKYMCEKQPGQKCFYAIKRASVDHEKVRVLGDTIEYGSLQHWLAYFLCRYNISSQKGGKPNAALCAFMELSGRFHPHNIFLQHGVIINDLQWLYADRSVIEMFITSTVPETKFVREHFGYPEGTVVMSGLPRFDALHDLQVDPKMILIMPTWREWFFLKFKDRQGVETNFQASEYLEKWRAFLTSPRLRELIKTYDLHVVFYPHRNMQGYLDAFRDAAGQVEVASWGKYDIQTLIKSAALMITDYSSVFFDMVYMKKPVIFYQFDEEQFRRQQYAEGYFDYHDNPFGKSFPDQEGIFAEMERCVRNGCRPDETFLRAHGEAFPYWDDRNSERIYERLKGRAGA